MADAFYAKVLLFGEYSLIAGSNALTMPERDFSGRLEIGKGLSGPELIAARASNKQLCIFYSFLADPESFAPGFAEALDLDRLRADLENVLYFRSTIPSGYGLGSSGALVAAVYHRYSKENEKVSGQQPEQLRHLRTLLAAMESFFHVTSSGIDPLSCYVGEALLVDGKGGVRIVDQHPFPAEFSGGFFLLDTGIAGKTGPLVSSFIEKTSDNVFRAFMERRYIPVNDACIAALLQNNVPELLSLQRKISVFQREHFLPMIPASMLEAWDVGVGSGIYSLKLCGSGGGGYLLGFTENYPRAIESLGSSRVIPLRWGTP
jgi:mevalonate kinase